MINAKTLFYHYPLGINLRNYLIKRANSPAALRLADDKIAFKKLLRQNGLKTANSFYEMNSHYDLCAVKSFPDEFVIKPNRGLGGNGIILIKRRGDDFINPSEKIYTDKELRQHVKRIMDGEYSGQMEQDACLIEERIYCSNKLRFKEALGLPDIRVFCFNNLPVLAMIRYPTAASAGRANLTAGALGLALDLESGAITRVSSKKTKRNYSLAEIGVPENFRLPAWSEIKAMAKKTAELSGLKIAGVDIVLDAADQPLVLEINGRPGLEIQNINGRSLLESMAD
ncbi:MAG: sugar-transfer associated ATP-grasp domain-containing protein [bacterium]|nr:sugar-transfer associated ATP-grasp domain-containing protein [bacterium]